MLRPSGGTMMLSSGEATRRPRTQILPESGSSIPARLLLSDFLRHELKLTGTHVGCEVGVCGACTVIVDGAPARSCLMFAVQVDNCTVRTVESLAVDGVLSPLQVAFSRHHALQC